MIASGSSKSKVAVFSLDVDRFRAINDALGRLAGDELLKQVAERLGAGGDESRLARIGGDDFAVVASEAQNEEQLARLTELTLKECFSQPFRIGDDEVRASAKIGIAVFPNDGADADALLRSAEAAVEKAKASGERYLFYTQEMTERLRARSDYAVGGITLRSGLFINGLSLTFMRIDGKILDPRRAYTSEWVGDRTGGSENSLSVGDGVVVGVYGSQDDDHVYGLLSQGMEHVEDRELPPTLRPERTGSAIAEAAAGGLRRGPR